MYKKIKKMMILSSIAGLIFISFVIIFYNMVSWKKFSEDYKIQKEEKVDYFFEDQRDDLESILNSHAVWTDALENLKLRNETWLNDNATGYMVGHPSYNVDFIYIANETETFSKLYSNKELGIDLSTLDIYNDALKDNKVQEDLIWIDEQLAFVSISPFYDNNEENPYGVYLIGKIIDTEEIAALKTLLSNKDVSYIEFSNQPMVEKSRWPMNWDIYLNVPLDSTETFFTNISFDLTHLSYLFFHQPLVIILLIAVIMAGLFWFINNNIKYMTKKLKEVIAFIKRISDGEYHLEIERERGKLFPELESLMTSTNRMAEDIRRHIESVEERNIALDEKYKEVINLLNNVVEMNDQYTYHHSSQVSEYALALGKTIGFEDLENLALAAKLHDIGKVAIPTEILNKPSRLTEEEYKIIKTHSKWGYDLLSRSKIFHEARMGVLYHHERYDGLGYPMGLKGEDIPMMAQIITVADAFEAMTSDRSYRKAMSKEKALKILIQDKGKMFNPDLVDVFVEMIKNNTFKK
jgi:putative nucleotidyltransferase with HDIG domain